jgi:hypothetical protein
MLLGLPAGVCPSSPASRASQAGQRLLLAEHSLLEGAAQAPEAREARAAARRIFHAPLVGPGGSARQAAGVLFLSLSE